jgi:hypothetical protein
VCVCVRSEFQPHERNTPNSVHDVTGNCGAWISGNKHRVYVSGVLSHRPQSVNLQRCVDLRFCR